MAMHDISPLCGWQERFDTLAHASLALRVRQVPFLAQVLLRIDPLLPATKQIEHALGLQLPSRFGEYSRAGGIDACWLGPDEWLLIAPAASATAVVATIAAPAGQAHHMVLDISANRTCIELSGADARYVLAKGSHEDIAPAAFSGSRVVQTVLAKVPVILQVHSPAAFRIFVRNSFAVHLARWLIDSASELIAARRHGVDALQERFGAAG